MKIIKEGTPNPALYFKCPQCGCVIETDKSDPDILSLYTDDPWYGCPNCRHAMNKISKEEAFK